ncbi:MAG: hypothetical protein E7399_03025 [Ruminococcaceae bacterium]|nr:hypothetical protein [Oscillospiraceae bacterium]
MNWNQTVTVLHKEMMHGKEIWTSQVFRGVSAVRVQKSLPYSAGMEPDNQLIVRIPATSVLSIHPGDRLVMGEKQLESTDVNQAFLVLSVTDNRRGGGNLWHYKVVCQS